jgi:hypothetical protein
VPVSLPLVVLPPVAVEPEGEVVEPLSCEDGVLIEPLLLGSLAVSVEELEDELSVDGVSVEDEAPVEDDALPVSVELDVPMSADAVRERAQ